MSTGNLSILNNDTGSSASDSRFLRPGKWWYTEDERIVCDLCPRECKLGDGDRGFCFVRQNIDGRMMLTTYGRSTGFCIDPIEKKPLNHFFPGTSVLSFGTAGCNLGCKFCQNWDISKSREVERLSSVAMPDAVARAAQAHGCHSVAFTYNDPIIWAEYAIDTADACHAQDIKTVAVTAGYITEQARDPFFRAMDAANVDLKAFTEEFYYKLTLSHIQPVLDTLKWLKAETDVWFEITNLVIPDANDSPTEFQELCDWVLEAVGDDVPVHFTAFHPDYRMTDRPRTPPATLNTARDTALRAGLKYVYTGNVDDVTRQSTYCPGCGRIVIERNWYELGTYALEGNRCRHCSQEIAGHFEDRPGSWGRQRLPVDMRRFAAPDDSVPVNVAPAASNERVFGNPTASNESRQSSPEGGSPMQATLLNFNDLTDEQQDSILDAASEFVVAAVEGRRPSSSDAGIGGCADQIIPGTFVSLKRKGQLRSCCGTIGRPMRLTESLSHSAERTATDDPRFPPVSSSELAHLDMEVWLLGASEPVPETGEDRIGAVQVGRDGLQVARGNQRGLLLPGVPVDHDWSSEEFLNQTCIKAGLPPTAWKDDSTALFRFPGVSMTRPVLKSDQAVSTPAAKKIFGAREFAQYAQHCRRSIDTLLKGGVPLYYVPEVSDANVSGVALIATQAGTDNVLTLSRVSWKTTVPMQATLHTLCEEASKVLARSGVSSDDFDLSLVVAHDPAMHGNAAAPDLSGIDTAQRGVLVFQGNRSTFQFDPNESVEALVESARDAAGIVQPQSAQVVSLAVQTNADQFTITSKPQAAAGVDVRPAAVAGQFYPGDAGEISSMLDDLFEGEADRGCYPAAMIPHAGWRFSGRVAADVLKRIEIPKTVIVIGPKHTPHGVEWAVAPHSSWSLPTGAVASDSELAQALCEEISGLELDAAAHQREHGIEVELPLIQRLAPEARVVGIAIGGGDLDRCDQFAAGLAKVVAGLDEPPLLLISSDMNHFDSDAETRRLDELALAQIDRLDPDSLLTTCRENHISMCGILPAVMVMKTLQKLNKLRSAERVGYATSCDATGDASRVVGYAGVLFA